LTEAVKEAKSEIKPGDLVKIHYTIIVLDDGKEQVYETTEEEVAKEAGIYDEKRRYGPVWVTVGQGRLIDALEEALLGAKVGETKEVIAEPEKAYGSYDKTLIKQIPLKRLRQALGVNRIYPGMEVKLDNLTGRVVKVTERFAYVDFNHPLAGKTLKIVVKVLEKAESDSDKVKALAQRYFGSEVDVEEAEDSVIVKLPPSVVLFSDLDARIRTFLEHVYENTSVPKLVIKIEFEFKREEAGSEEEDGESEETSGEKSPESS